MKNIKNSISVTTYIHYCLGIKHIKDRNKIMYGFKHTNIKNTIRHLKKPTIFLFSILFPHFDNQ